jgi:hypothetical protein
MRARTVLLLVALVVSSASALQGIAVAGGAAPTRLTIHGPDGDFHGAIFSDLGSCLGHRTVRVFMSKSADGPFDRIGSDTSQRDGAKGVWSIGNSGYRDGYFYARVAKTTGCRSDRSRLLHLVNGVPQ